MIDETSKKELLKELEKTGNIYFACQKLGISRATFYRWMQDKQFKKDATRSINLGRESSCDIAEYALIKGAKEGKIENIKYYLVHNSKRYKPKKSDKFIIEHKTSQKTPQEPQKTLEDLFDDATINNEESIRQLREKYEKMGGIPLKADGTTISDEELWMYEGYIIEHYKKKKADNGS